MNSEIILLYLKFKQWYYGGITIVDTTIHRHTMTDEDSQLATELKSNHKETDTYILTQNMSVSHTIKLLYLEIPTNVFVDRKVAGDILLILILYVTILMQISKILSHKGLFMNILLGSHYIKAWDSSTSAFYRHGKVKPAYFLGSCSDYIVWPRYLIWNTWWNID